MEGLDGRSRASGPQGGSEGEAGVVVDGEVVRVRIGAHPLIDEASFSLPWKFRFFHLGHRSKEAGIDDDDVRTEEFTGY